MMLSIDIGYFLFSKSLFLRCKFKEKSGISVSRLSGEIEKVQLPTIPRYCKYAFAHFAVLSTLN